MDGFDYFREWEDTLPSTALRIKNFPVFSRETGEYEAEKVRR
jgi:hypothetical protein